MPKYEVDFYNNGDYMKTKQISANNIDELIIELASIVRLYNTQLLLWNITYVIRKMCEQEG